MRNEKEVRLARDAHKWLINSGHFDLPFDYQELFAALTVQKALDWVLNESTEKELTEAIEETVEEFKKHKAKEN